MKESVLDLLLMDIANSLDIAKELESKLGQIRQEMIAGAGQRRSGYRLRLASTRVHTAHA
ncbi:MAG: hypothetical protein OES09_04015 [Gammaproteobacteria bacterium]|nr:hypothetical protein [Gammaproteobacteria bacterium]